MDFSAIVTFKRQNPVTWSAEGERVMHKVGKGLTSYSLYPWPGAGGGDGLGRVQFSWA